MIFRCESAAALFSELLFSYSDSGNWTEMPMTNLENLTYQTTVPYTVGQDFHYLMKARRDSLVWLTPAKITSTTFPPAVNSMSFIGSDPVGDSNVLNDNNLDITGTYFGYSDTKFYAAIENISGTYPTITGLAGFNVYACGLLNPEAALADSTLFAMVYVNVPFLYSTGIYKIKLSLTDFQFSRVGNATAQVSNGKLFMSCNISDLTSQAEFGAWPNTTHILGFDVATIQAGIAGTSLVPTIADWGPFTTFSFEDYVVPAYTNHLPVLSNAYLTFNGIQNVLTVTYSDEDSDFPLLSIVQLDNNQTSQLTTLFPDFSAPVEFTCFVPASGWNTGSIQFSDNETDFSTLPISLTANQDSTIPSPIVFHIFPNPFSLRSKSDIEFQFTKQQNDTSELAIYNIKGQIVKHLEALNCKAGENHISWNCKDELGKYVSPGIYISQLNSNSHSITHKFLVLP
jgi:hypothetical protein